MNGIPLAPFQAGAPRTGRRSQGLGVGKGTAGEEMKGDDGEREVRTREKKRRGDGEEVGERPIGW